MTRYYTPEGQELESTEPRYKAGFVHVDDFVDVEKQLVEVNAECSRLRESEKQWSSQNLRMAGQILDMKQRAEAAKSELDRLNKAFIHESGVPLDAYVKQLESALAAKDNKKVIELCSELLMSKMTHNFTFTRDELIDLFGGMLEVMRMANLKSTEGRGE